jgi:hypothetical protein
MGCRRAADVHCFVTEAVNRQLLAGNCFDIHLAFSLHDSCLHKRFISSMRSAVITHALLVQSCLGFFDSQLT